MSAKKRRKKELPVYAIKFLRRPAPGKEAEPVEHFDTAPNAKIALVRLRRLYGAAVVKVLAVQRLRPHPAHAYVVVRTRHEYLTTDQDRAAKLLEEAIRREIDASVFTWEIEKLLVTATPPAKRRKT